MLTAEDKKEVRSIAILALEEAFLVYKEVHNLDQLLILRTITECLQNYPFSSPPLDREAAWNELRERMRRMIIDTVRDTAQRASYDHQLAQDVKRVIERFFNA